MPKALILKKSPDISHLVNLTDDTGIFQHSKFAVPDPKFGYSTDDNARALIIALKYFKDTKGEVGLGLARTYLSFLRFAQDEKGKFFTFLNYQRNWQDVPGLGDSFGRAMWALGFTAFSGTSLVPPAKWLFDESKRHLGSLPSLRSKAFSILGINFYVSALKRGEKDLNGEGLLKNLADEMVSVYYKNSDKNWHWFEGKITYENPRLPQALLVAFQTLLKAEYKEIGLSSLDFLLATTFDEKKKCFDFVGQKGWLVKGGQKAIFDQQPVEAGSTVEACILAFKLTKERKYLDFAKLAFEWFLGKNRLGVSLYDPKTKGVKDGLTSVGANENQGAESILSFLLAHFALKGVL